MEHSERPCIITGNWKMYKTIEESVDFVKRLIPHINDSSPDIFLAVPFTSIQPLSKEAAGSSLQIGAQNMNDASEGAFTGEVAARMLKDAGATFVILGHSERRNIFHEENDFINRKVKRAIKEGLRPVLCIGESKEDREAGKTEEVIQKQLKECLANIDIDDLSTLIVAYEPIWAIGANNRSASPEIAQETHMICRRYLSEILSPELAEQLVIQYGGSVNPENASNLLRQPDIDGLLIGGASLSLESFVEIMNDRSHID